jgi:hypothetical protein
MSEPTKETSKTTKAINMLEGIMNGAEFHRNLVERHGTEDVVDAMVRTAIEELSHKTAILGAMLGEPDGQN